MVLHDGTVWEIGDFEAALEALLDPRGVERVRTAKRLSGT